CTSPACWWRDVARLADLSVPLQGYPREIYKRQAGSERVRTTALAQRMGVKPPSATAMVKKLAARGLVDHRPYYGVRLTRRGQQPALEALGQHRLLQAFLVTTPCL